MNFNPKCICGHEGIAHRQFGPRSAYICYIQGCDCTGYHDEPEMKSTPKCICGHYWHRHSDLVNTGCCIGDSKEGCSCKQYKHDKGENSMPKETMTRRFYATKSAINAPVILQTLGEATETAKTRMFGQDIEEYYIVEVVRIVRLPKPVVNIEVVDVRRD